METNANDIIPVRATHPGSVLKRELQARGIKQKDFAAALGMPAPNLTEIIKGRRNISETIAIRLEEALGIPFQTWMNLQNRYSYVARRRAELNDAESRAATEERSLSSRLNLAVLYKYAAIAEATAARRIEKLKRHFDIDLNRLQALEVSTVGFFKRSDTLRVDDVNMRTWLLLAWCEAANARVDTPFATDGALIAAADIARCANAGTLTVGVVKDILNSCGIIFCHVPKLDAAPIDAYSSMVEGHPAIVVTLRHDDINRLAFDVLHELGHIVRHLSAGKSFISVEGDYSSLSAEEKEADGFAADTLIPPAAWRSIMSEGATSLTPAVVARTIAASALRHGISPTIAVARYKHDTRCYAIRGHRSPRLR